MLFFFLPFFPFHFFYRLSIPKRQSLQIAVEKEDGEQRHGDSWGDGLFAACFLGMRWQGCQRLCQWGITLISSLYPCHVIHC
ncbi:uncharacterized [Tachysurus ichikawai]